MITFSHVSKEYTTEDGKTRVYDARMVSLWY